MLNSKYRRLILTGLLVIFSILQTSFVYVSAQTAGTVDSTTGANYGNNSTGIDGNADKVCAPNTSTPQPGTNPCDTGLPVVGAGSDQLKIILQIVFGVMAAAAVLIIVIAGLRFVISQGNPQETAKARNTIIYAAAGLLIALTAETIVSFVLTKL